MPGVAEHERRADIVRLLAGGGRVGVGELADRYGVSLVTIRKDLNDLEARRLARRVRGGAVAIDPVFDGIDDRADEGAFELRLRERVAQKRAIARAAAQRVGDGDAIAMDCSTTCYYLAEELRERRGLVVLTNGLRVAELLGAAGATVVMPGGTLRRSSWSLVGEITDVIAERGRLARGFFGVWSISVTHGLMELSAEETEVKRRLVRACAQVYGLFDSTKAGRFALHSFAGPEQITGLITDTELADEAAAPWIDAGVPVHRANP